MEVSTFQVFLQFFPREFVILSCQVLDRELLSAAIKILFPLANCSISSMFVKLFFYLFLNIEVHTHCTNYYFFSCIISKTTLSSFDVCVMSMASILFFGITIAALCFPFPAVNILHFFPIQTGLF